MSRATDVLHQLLAVTPKPPADADTQALKDGIDEGIRARKAILETSGATGPLELDGPEDMVLLAELNARRQAWSEALEARRTHVGEQLIATRRMRAYGKR